MRYQSNLRNINRGYMNLEVWKESVDLSTTVREKVNSIKGLPLKLRGQIEDSIVSVPSNISEGYSRRYIKEYIQHLNYSLASLSENFTQILILYECNDIDEQWFLDYDKTHYSIENKLLALIKSLIRKLKQKDGWDSDYQIREIIETYGLD